MTVVLITGRRPERLASHAAVVVAAIAVALRFVVRSRVGSHARLPVCGEAADDLHRRIPPGSVGPTSDIAEHGVEPWQEVTQPRQVPVRAQDRAVGADDGAVCAHRA